MSEKSKEQRIKAEKNRLSRIYKKIEGDKAHLAKGLIDRVAFLRIECEDLEDDIRQNGWVELFEQKGVEPYNRARPQGQAYQSSNANYQKCIKLLDSLLPVKSGSIEKDDGFDSFIDGRDA